MGEEEDDERSIMSPISLIIHSMISSICTSTQSQNSHSTTDKRGYITFEALVAQVTPGKNKLLTFPNNNMKYQNELPKFQRREAQASTLSVNHQYWSFHGIDA